MTLLFVSFLAGMLTTLAPCILPLLPVVVGGGMTNQNTKRTLRRPILIITSLAISIIVFTLLLKASTVLLGVPQDLWRWISGSIVILLGLGYIFPALWNNLALALKLPQRTNKALFSSSSRKTNIGAILTGAALGPVFTSCSPTYALIVAAVLPVSFLQGLIYLLAYVLGMAIVLFLVIWLGSALTKRLGWALNENGLFHKVIGVIFVLVGLAVLFGFDKILQVWLLDAGLYDGTSGLENLF